MRAPRSPEGWMLMAALACALLVAGSWAIGPRHDPWQAGAGITPGEAVARAVTEAVRHGAPGPALDPVVRVRLSAFEGARQLRIAVIGAWSLLDESGAERASGVSLDGLLRADPTGVQLGPYLCGLDRLILAPAGEEALRVEQERYTGALEIGVQREGPRAVGLSLVLHLALEDYVLGVVCGEMATSASGVGAALRAQAVAARSWALWETRRRKGALRDTPADQTFRGLDWHTDAAREAVAETRGLVLAWEEELLPAFFHAACGGATSDAAALGFLERALPPLAGTRDPGCEAAPPWSEVVPAERLDRAARALGLGGWLRSIHALERDAAGRLLRLRLLGETGRYDGPSEEARARFGVPSAAWIAAEPRPDGSLRLEGRGLGHGIGLCQSGARRLAQAGAGWRDILSHYYPGAAVLPLSAALIDA